MTDLVMLQNFKDRFVQLSPKVEQFINEHAGMDRLIKDAVRELATHFPDTEFDLEVHTDPEEGWSILVILILTTLDVEEVIKILDRFYEEYWFDSPWFPTHTVLFNARRK